MKIYCVRAQCERLLFDIDFAPAFLSANVRCECGARYHMVKDKLSLISDHMDGLSLDEISRVSSDPALKHSDRVVRLQQIEANARKAASLHSIAYGQVAHEAAIKAKECNALANKQQEGLYSFDRVAMLTAMCQAMGVEITGDLNDKAYQEEIAGKVGL